MVIHMKKTFVKALCLALSLLALMCSCTEKNAENSQNTAQSSVSSMEDYVLCAPDNKVYSFADNSPVFSLEQTFYPCSVSVELLTEQPCEIYYTLDGSDPTKESELYAEPILFERESDDFPKAHTVKAKAFYSDGSESAVSVHTYFCSKNIDERFTTAVFSITGDPADLTDAPNGILYGTNYELRGEESERCVYLQAWDESGSEILSQYCGVRLYGGASRESSIKSFKLIARKRYLSEKGSFKTDIFQTPVCDSSGEVVSKYKKLVLRNSGNDFQFAFIRDELSQNLAMQAGFDDYEAVVPAVCYLNGEYYGFFWLHENYCDDYFKNKYPNETANGEFVIIEGTETSKDVDESDDKSLYAAQFNDMYDEFCALDLTKNENYASLCEFMDVENYLDYYAFNIYINNKDWPQNNYKCYRYAKSDSDGDCSGVYDGKWRFLLHDMDYTYGMYEQVEVMADYNNIEQILDKNSERYSPLFENLMHRSDCREYFLSKLNELAQNVLCEENILNTLNQMSSERYFEQNYYYKYIERERNNGASDLWTYSSHLTGYVQIIKDFASQRGDYILNFADSSLAKFANAAQ